MFIMYMNILAEKSFAYSRWFDEVIEGINLAVARKDIILNLVDNIENIKNLPKEYGKLCIAAGGSAAWLEEALNTLEKYGFRSVAVGSGTSAFSGGTSVIDLDYARSCYQAVRYMESIGCEKIAFCGLNTDACSDMIKYGAFQKAVGTKEEDVYINRGNAEQCCRELAENIEHYDGVICANDYIAVMLVRLLGKQAGKIEIASFGNTAALEFIFPQIIKITLDFKSAGQKAAEAYIYLAKNENVLRMSMTVKCNIMAHGRTLCLAENTPESIACASGKVDFYNDPAINKMLKFEHLLCSMDDLDVCIFDVLVSGKTYEQTAEILNTSVATVKYRIKRLMALCGFAERKEMLKLYTEFAYIRIKGAE